MIKHFLLTTTLFLTIFASATAGDKTSVFNQPQDRPEKDSVLLLPRFTNEPLSFMVKNVNIELIPVEKSADATEASTKPSQPYYIGKTEVTQRLWESVMGSNPSIFKGALSPVENISWEEVQEFIIKLQDITGYAFRLPSEFEWEFAAQGGNLSKGYKYSGSNKIDGVAWYTINSKDKTSYVAKKEPNELGIYDMSGNVEEWCSDAFYEENDGSGSKVNTLQTRYVQKDLLDNLIVPRVIRGGCWDSRAKGCLTTARDGSDRKNSKIGFRLCISAVE